MTTKIGAKLVRAVIIIIIITNVVYKTICLCEKWLNSSPSSLPLRHKTEGSGRLPAPDWNTHFSFKIEGSGFDFR